MENKQLTVDADQLRTWLEAGKDVVVLDVRPKEQREEWQIPDSIYVDAYQRLNANDPSVLDEVSIPQNVPVVTVCAAGRTSLIAATKLRKKGIEAYSLEGGMKAWSIAWNTATLTFSNFSVVQYRRTGKGCLSYMIISDGEAIVVDASLSVETYEQVLREQGLSLKFTVDTHIHADHLSRSKQLAHKFNVPFYLPAQNKVTFDFKPIVEDVSLKVGKVSIKAIKTPGHTLESMAYLVEDKVLFTGDTLFIDSIGRPDLKASTEKIKQKAGLLFHSLQKLTALDDGIIVLPGHTSKPVDFNNIPIQASLTSIKQNVSMLHLSEEEFVQTILLRIPPTPANYLAIVEKNIAGSYDDVSPEELEAGANRCAIS
jgi:glyoxylase-like metal-dependent hydrolase (beta-lactamase superfamily II)/rhodanese-related sulfurtransferase